MSQMKVDRGMYLSPDTSRTDAFDIVVSTKRIRDSKGSRIEINSSKISVDEAITAKASTPVEEQTNGKRQSKRSVKDKAGELNIGDDFPFRRSSSLRTRSIKGLTKAASESLPIINVTAAPTPKLSASASLQDIAKMEPVKSEERSRRGSWIKRIGAIASTPTTPSSSPPASPSRPFHSHPTSPSCTPRTSPVRRRAISVSDCKQQQQQQQLPNIASASSPKASTSWGGLANRLGLRGFSREKTKRSNTPVVSSSEPEVEIIAEDAKEIADLIEFFKTKTSGPLPEFISSFTLALELPMTIQYGERLVELSKNEANKIVIGRSLGVFVALLRDDHKRYHACALQLIRNLVTVEATKNIFRTSNGFPYLIRLLETGDDNIQKLAIACIGFLLTNNPANADAFVAEKGVPPLIDLLRSSVEIVQLLAAGVTWVLASNEPKQKAEVFNCGGHILLLDLLDSTSNIDVMWQAAGAIRNLAFKNETIQDVLYQTGAIQILLKRLSTMTNEKVIGHLAAALLALSEYPKVRTLMRDINGFSIVFSIIESVTYSASIRDIGLGILKNLIQSEENQVYVINNTKILDTVLRLMADSTSSENIKGTSCVILECLIQNNLEVAKLASDKGALKLVLNLLTSENSKILQAPLSCVRLLCHQKVQDIEIVVGYVESIVRLLSSTYSLEVQEKVACILGELSILNDNFMYALASGQGIPLLMNCLFEEEFEVVVTAVKTLCILLEAKEIVEKHTVAALQLKGSIVERLLSFVLYEKEPELQINSLKCLHYLAVDEQIKSNIVSFGGILVFTQCFSATRLTSLVIEGLKVSEAVVNKSTKHQTLWREQGIFAKLLPLFSYEGEEVLVPLLQFIRALVADNVKCQDDLRSAGLLLPVISLLNHAKPAIQVAALLLLCDASLRHAKIPNCILKLNGIEALVSCLSSSSEDVKRYAALALEIIVTKNVKIQCKFQEHRGFSLLVPLVRSDNAEIAYHALGAILALCYKNTTNKDECKRYGIAEALRTTRENHEVTKGSANPSLKSRIEEALKAF